MKVCALSDTLDTHHATNRCDGDKASQFNDITVSCCWDGHGELKLCAYAPVRMWRALVNVGGEGVV